MNLDTLVLPTDTRPVDTLIKAGEIDAPDDYDLYPGYFQPRQVSRRFVGDKFTTVDGHFLLRYWRGDFWLYDGTTFHIVDDEADVREPMWDRLEEVTVKVGDDEEKPWAPTSARLNGLMEPIQIETRLPNRMDAPMLTNKRSRPTPAPGVIAMGNGLFDLTTRELQASSPAMFTTWALPFDYDPAATCPTWTNFMAETFAHDPEAIDVLQEWFGYCVSERTDQQKGLLLMGPGGSGKGVTTRILEYLVGHDNVAATNMEKLSKGFGLANLVGKQLAVIPDSRDSGTINETATSTLLSVIGEDSVPVEKKGIDIMTMKLPTRIVLVSNEMPSFKDSSGALVKRWIVVETKVGVRGTDREDPHLGAKLAAELPGIFNWALDGLDRLNRNGRFTNLESTTGTVEMLHDAAAPEAQFMDEHFKPAPPEEFVWLAEVYEKYRQWMEARGNRSVSQNRFKNRVKAAGLPGLTFTKRDQGGARKEAIAGISWS